MLTVTSAGTRSMWRVVVAAATWLGLVGAAGSCFSICPPAVTPKRAIVVDSIVPNHYIVVLKPGVVHPTFTSADSALQDSLAGRDSATGTVAVTHRYKRVLGGFAARLTPAQATKVRSDARVAYVAPVRTYRRARAVRETQVKPPWDLDRIDQVATDGDGTFTYHASGQGVTIYVIDDGVDAQHQDFGKRVGDEMVYSATATTPAQCAAHGTHVAGAAAGTYSGVAKNASVVSVRIFDCDATTTSDVLIKALDDLAGAARKPAVVIMSLESGGDQPTDEATRQLINGGVVVVVAAGNSNADACDVSPARVTAAITVGATDNNDTRWYDEYEGSNYGTCVTLFAPGVNVAGPVAGTASDITYSSSVGTSFAAPLAAGVAAQYLELHPNASPAVVKEKLIEMAQRVVKERGTGSTRRLLFTSL